MIKVEAVVIRERVETVIDAVEHATARADGGDRDVAVSLLEAPEPRARHADEVRASGLPSAVGIDLEAGQAQRDAHRRGIGQPALAALVGVIFGMLELVAVEVEVRGAGEILDREDRAQCLFES